MSVDEPFNRGWPPDEMLGPSAQFFVQAHSERPSSNRMRTRSMGIEPQRYVTLAFRSNGGADSVLGPDAWFSGLANPVCLKLNLIPLSRIGAGLKAVYEAGLLPEGTGGQPGKPAEIFIFLCQLVLPKRKYIIPGFRPLCRRILDTGYIHSQLIYILVYRWH